MADNTHDEDAYVDDLASDESFEDSPVDESAEGHEDDWSEDYEDDGEQADDNAPPAKKKSKISNILIIAVVLVLAAGFFLLKGGDETPPPPGGVSETPEAASDKTETPNIPDQPEQVGETTQPSEDLQKADAESNPDGTKASDAGADQGIMLTDNVEKAVSVVEVEKDIPKKPLPKADDAGTGEENAQTGNAPANGAADPLKQDGAPAPVAAPTSEADFPTVDKILKPQADTNATKEEVAPAPDLSKVAPPVTAVPALDSDAIKKTEAYQSLAADLAEEKAKVADLQKRLDNQPKEVPQDNSAEVEALKNKIAELESKISSRSSDVAPRVNAANAHSQHSIKKVKAAAVQTAKRNEGAQRWVLKAASPGRALVSLAGGDDLKTVHVGDNLGSIGRILSIDAGARGWTIKGTQGSISQ